MKIELRKLDNNFHEICITRSDGSTERARLETKTFFLHDICHFCVETELGYTEGFWGMLSKGYGIAQLKGKTNELTEELRRVECVVGITQSYYMKNVDEAHLWYYLDSVGIKIQNKRYLQSVVSRMDEITNKWKGLAFGAGLQLKFDW